MQTRKASNGRTKSVLTLFSFKIDPETLKMLDEIAEKMREKAVESGEVSHGHGRSQATRRAIRFMHANWKDA